MGNAHDDGVDTLFGRGPDDVDFQEWLRRAEGGNVAAQNNVGAYYASGTGVPQDYREALKWWRRAAEQGAAAAQYAIGNLYSNGQAVPQDNKQAATYWV